MINKIIGTFVLILALIMNLPEFFKFIWAAYRASYLINKEYKNKKSEDNSND